MINKTTNTTMSIAEAKQELNARKGTMTPEAAKAVRKNGWTDIPVTKKYAERLDCRYNQNIRQQNRDTVRESLDENQHQLLGVKQVRFNNNISYSRSI